MKNPIQLLLADDHEIFRDGFKQILRKNTQIKLVGEAGNGEELIIKALELKPDVVITDIKMPLIDGIEATTELIKRMPALKVIALSMDNEETQIIDMLEAGAKGYLLKNTDKSDIIEAIKSVYNNKNYYCESTNNKLATMIHESRFDPVQPSNIPAFTQRQLEVMKLICQGLSYQEIADLLYISKRTVEWHVKTIMEKIDAKNQAGIIVYAIRNKIFK